MLDAALSFLWPDTMNNFTFLEPDIEQVPYSGPFDLPASNKRRLDRDHACAKR